MRIAKWVLGIAAGAIALLVVALVVLTLLVDPNRFKGRIESLVAALTNRPFTIRGELEIGWYPWLALETGAASLGNPPGFTGAPLAQWDAVRVGVRLVPLVRGQLVVDRVRARGLRLHLQRSSDGRANWDELLSGVETRESAADSTRAPLPGIGGIEIREGAIDFEDARAGTRLEVSSWKLEVDEWRPGSETSIETSFEMKATLNGADDADARGDSAQQAEPWHAVVDFASRVRASGDLKQVKVRDLKLDARVRGGVFPASAGVPIQLRVPQLSASGASVTLPTASLSMAGLDARAAVGIEHPNEGALRARGTLELHGDSLRDSLRALGIDAPLPRDRSLVRTLELRSAWAYDDGAIALEPLAIKLDDTTFTGEALRAKAGRLTFALRGDQMDIGRYAAVEDTGGEPFELPVARLKALRATGEVRLEQAKLADAQVRGVTLRVESDGAGGVDGRD